MRILPQRLKNSAMAAIHRTKTNSTIRASSARMIMGEVPPTPIGGGETKGGAGTVGATAGALGRFPVSAGSGSSVLFKFLICFSGKMSAKTKQAVEMSVYKAASSGRLV